MHHNHHILMEETDGQDVVLNILEAFVNRWRHALANVASLCPETRERWKATFNLELHEDRREEMDKREINQT